MTVKLPFQKQPIDVGGKVLINKEWYRALLNLVTQSNTTVLGGLTDEKGKNGSPGFAAGTDFTPGTTVNLTLSKNYGAAANLFITFDGTWQGADQFSLSGFVVTFNSAIPVGVNKVYVKGFI